MQKFNHSKTSQEGLSIFLYNELILKQSLSHISIDDYISFQLTDKIIASYNLWIDNGCPNLDIVENWCEQNEVQVSRFKNEFGTTFKPKVELWSDRDKTDYFTEKLQISFDFEHFIYNIFKDKGIDLGEYLTSEGQYKGENERGIEIKNDTLIKKTGNIYIEYMEKSKASNWVYVNSGILKDDNTKFLLIGDYDEFWIFRKDRLVEIFNEEISINHRGQSSPRGIQFKQIATSRGFVYPVKEAIKETVSINTVIDELIKSE